MAIASYTPLIKQLMLSGIMSNSTVSRLPRINAEGLFFLWLAGVTTAIALGFLSFTAYIYLATIYVHHIAGLIVAGSALAVALIAASISILYMSRRAQRYMTQSAGPQPDIAKTVTALIDSIAEELEEPIRENPKTAIMIASLAGFLAGDTARH